MQINTIDNIHVQKIQGCVSFEEAEAPQAAATQPLGAGMCSCVSLSLSLSLMHGRAARAQRRSVLQVASHGSRSLQSVHVSMYRSTGGA